MRIVYMGTPQFACRPLLSLAQSEHELIAVVTGPDEPLKRGSGTRPTPVCADAQRLDLPILRPAKLSSKSLREQLAVMKPDLFVVVAFRILPRKLFTLPSRGSINIHASLLPKYRGAAPMNWAIINGEKETGLTSFILNEKVDTGGIIHQQATPIGAEENFDSLYERLSEMSGPFVLESIRRLTDPSFEPQPQDDSLASPAPKITPENSVIDWNRPAHKVTDFVRGLATVPGAYSFFRDQRVKISKVRPVECTEQADIPGTILPGKKRLLVQCAGSVVEVEQLMPQGKRCMEGQAFVNGYRPQAGELFGQNPESNE